MLSLFLLFLIAVTNLTIISSQNYSFITYQNIPYSIYSNNQTSNFLPGIEIEFTK